MNDIHKKDKYDLNKYLIEIDSYSDSDSNVNLYFSKAKFSAKKNDDFCLTEIDFYPPSDERYLESYVEDIYGGDNFADYCKEFFEMLEEEGYYD